MKNQIRTNYFIIYIVLLISLVGCNSKIYKNKKDTSTSIIDATLKPFSIKGNVSKVKDSIDKIVLIYTSNGEIIKDTCDIKNGKYFFSGKIRDARYASLKAIKINNNTDDKNKYKKVDEKWLFIEPAKMKTFSGDVFSDLTLTGSPGYIAFIEWQEALRPINDSMNKFLWEFLNARKAFDLSKTKEDSLLLAKLSIKSSNALEQSFDFNLQYANTHSQSPILMYILNNFPPPMFEKSDTYDVEKERLFNQASLALQNSELGEQIGNQVAVRLGKQGPDFSLPDMNGNPIKLSSTRGKYVLLEFWASWCSPCRAESPNLVKAYNEYKNDFTVFSVSIDVQSARQKWLDAIEKDGTNLWPQVFNQVGGTSDASLLYGKIGNIPANFLLDREGKIIAKDLRGLQLEEKLKEVIENKN
ncbi:MAG: AhpC/TSA family protein [Chitinophagaceae bacterium]|nr:AhpC/TSA family protein [Chitinophagaceae bacterium]MBK8605404.1 AhpC/TSA family protein [Chitinophagaceae bacterium]MBP7108689.1 AhpC/TSA family protein [Chitinophagaceae bacterium]MBP7313739.1 AhpC/TSA family protein [Chitinophagaceae bacterium]HQZ78647.1 TlpA disulfide reductase family protein [Bacteroidia bacterium]